MRDLAVWAGESPHTDEIMPFDDDDDGLRRLYFDPLYTLYRPLGPRDVVFVLDLSTLTNPEWHNALVARGYERAFRKLACSRARIVSISENCTAALRASFAIPSRDITTVPLYLREIGSASDGEAVTRLKGCKFLLFVGSLETRKNIVGLIQAFALSGLAEKDWLLVIAGGDGAGAESIREMADRIHAVELLGYVSDAKLKWLYHQAAAFVYPSFLEGFGLPLLEAMAQGLPCLASITGASTEICGDLGVLVNPYDMNSVVAGLQQCVDRVATMNDAARRPLIDRAQSFSFDRYMRALTPALA